MNLLVICIYFLDKCLFSSLVHTTIWYLLLWCMSFCYTLHGLCISYNWKLVHFDNLYPVFPSTSSLPLGTTNMIFFSEFNLFLFFFFWISQINMVIPKDRFGEDRDVGGQTVCQANSTDIVLQLAFMHLFPYKSASLLDHERPRGQVHLIHTWLMHRRAWETGQMKRKERRRHIHK